MISVDEDTPATNIDLFDNDDAATSRQVLQFIVPAPIAGDPATTYNASANVGALIPGRCTLTITPEGMLMYGALSFVPAHLQLHFGVSPGIAGTIAAFVAVGGATGRTGAVVRSRS